MHNIHELEKQWLTYKIKSFIPHISILLFSIISIVIFININPINFEEQAKIVEKKIVKDKINVPKESASFVAKVDIVKVEIQEQNKTALLKFEPKVEEKNIVLTPSLDFIKKLRNDSTNSYKRTYVKPVPTLRTRYKEDKDTEVEVSNKIVSKIKKLKIMRQETQTDIEYVIKRFQKNNNPALSLFIAKKYYRLADYKQAYNYSLITNELNNNIDDSWIIFSKSLVKLGKKKKAIATLKRYINYSHSYKAKSLLDEISAGKFK